jgi:hypothetical protein
MMSEVIENAEPTEESAPSEVAQINATPPAEATEGAASEKIESRVEKTFTQAELDSIVQKAKAKAEARAERRVTQAYRESLQSLQPQQVQSPSSTEPTREQFASDAEWIDAKVEHKLASREAQQRGVSTSQKVEALFKQADAIQGFDRDTFIDLPVSSIVADALMESAVGAQLMAFMSSNPEEAERIAKLPPARQAVEIGKLETRFEANVKKSTVPPPIAPIGAKGSATPDLDKLSFAEYKAQRMKDRPRWAR